MATTISISSQPDAIRPALEIPMQLGESPIWAAAEAALYWIDIAACELHRLYPASGMHQDWPLPSQPGCIALCADGGLIVAMRSGVACFDPRRGELTPLVDAPYDSARLRFNDGRCDSAGRLWVGTLYEPRDQPLAPLFRIERGVVRDSGLRATISNGIAFSPDGDTLYQADTQAHAIHAYAFDAARGTIGAKRVLREFSDRRLTFDYGGRPDGAAVDSEGAYWCAMYEGGRLLRLSPDGSLLQEILLPARCPTMPAFGGEDLRTLYITTARHRRPAAELRRYPLSGYVLSLRVEVPGRLETPYIR